MLQQLSLGPIAKLPAELLEKILLYAVDAAVDYSKESYPGPTYIWDQRRRQRLLESIRLVCHHFNDNAWRAYAKVIERTTFDLRSKASMQALSAISLHTELRPWIKRLRFAFDLVASTGAEEDHQCEQEELDAIKMVDERWFPDVWSLAGVSHQATDLFPLQSEQQIAVAGSLILFIARALRKFGPLKEVQYFKRWALPPRWSGVVQNSDAVQDSYAPYHDYTAQLGLEILLRALAEADQSPKFLDLAITTNQHHTFVCETPLPMIRRVMRKVEELRLCDAFESGTYAAEGRRVKQVILSKTTFPILRDLWVKSTSWTPINYPDALPQPSDIPGFSTLTAELHSDGDTPLEFVSRFGARTRKLILVNYIKPWPPLLARIAALKLDTFVLSYNDYFAIHGDHAGFVEKLEGVDEPMLRQAAPKFVIKPKQFQHRVLRHLKSPEEPPDRSWRSDDAYLWPPEDESEGSEQAEETEEEGVWEDEYGNPVDNSEWDTDSEGTEISDAVQNDGNPEDGDGNSTRESIRESHSESEGELKDEDDNRFNNEKMKSVGNTDWETELEGTEISNAVQNDGNLEDGDDNSTRESIRESIRGSIRESIRESHSEGEDGLEDEDDNKFHNEKVKSVGKTDSETELKGTEISDAVQNDGNPEDGDGNSTRESIRESHSQGEGGLEDEDDNEFNDEKMKSVGDTDWETESEGVEEAEDTEDEGGSEAESEDSVDIFGRS